jgi:hypothetical protein
VRPRSLLDVHHRHPLYEGSRVTTFADFALLRPTGHRFEHALLRGTPGRLSTFAPNLRKRKSRENQRATERDF